MIKLIAEPTALFLMGFIAEFEALLDRSELPAGDHQEVHWHLDGTRHNYRVFITLGPVGQHSRYAVLTSKSATSDNAPDELRVALGHYVQHDVHDSFDEEFEIAQREGVPLEAAKGIAKIERDWIVEARLHSENECHELHSRIYQ